jgi:hypothetical protein
MQAELIHVELQASSFVASFFELDSRWLLYYVLEYRLVLVLVLVLILVSIVDK